MPNLNSLLASPNAYPRSTGQQARVTDVPAEPLPLAGTAGQDALAAGVAQLGAGVADVGTGLARKAAVEAAQRKAQDQIDKALKLNTFTQEMDTYLVDRMQDTDYRQLPQVMRDYADQRIHVLGQDLTEQGRAFFRVAAGERKAVVNREAETYRQKSMLHDGVQAADVAGQQYTDGMLKTTSGEDTAQLTMQYLQTLDGLANTGVIARPEVQLRFRKSMQDVNTRQVDLAIETQPQAMLPHLLSLGDNQPGVEGLPVPPASEYARLIGVARKRINEITSQQDHAAVRLDRQQQKAQEEAGVVMRTRITQVVPIQANLADYDTLLHETNDLAGKKVLSGDQQREFDGLLRTMRHAAANPALVDDIPTERDMRRLVALAERPADFVDARAALLANIGKLKPETWSPLIARLEERSKSTHYTQQPGYRAGRAVLTDGIIPQAGYKGSAAVLKEEDMARLDTALQVYDARIQTLLTAPAGLQGMDAQAVDLAREIKTRYIDIPKGELKHLPVFLHGVNEQGIANRAEAIRLIEAERLPVDLRNEMLRRWDLWKSLMAPTRKP